MKKVTINQEEVSIDGSMDLLSLLQHQGINPVGIAVAVNNGVVKRTDWASRQLEDGDKIVVIRATCGG